MLCRRCLALVIVVAVIAPSLGFSYLLMAEAYVARPIIRGDVLIDDPRYSAPYVLLPGGSFNITLFSRAGGVSGAEVALVAPNASVEGEVAGYGELPETNYYYVTVKLPEDIEPGLYDIAANVSIGSSVVGLTSPRSVWVVREYPDVLHVMHISDTHLGLFVDGRHAYERYEAYVLLANALRDVNAVFITGDCVDVGSDLDSLKLFYSMTNQIRRPTFIVPGNHDWAQVFSYNDFRYKFYGVYIGRKHWVRSIGNITLVGLNTGSEGYLDTAELKWLSKTLNSSRERAVVLLFHYPIFNEPGRFRGSHKDLGPLISHLYSSWRDHLKDSLKPLLKLIDENPNVVAVFAGHIHRDAVALYNDRVWVVTTTTACAGRPYYRGFHLVDIYANGSVKVVVPKGRRLLSDTSSFKVEDNVFRVITHHDEDMKFYAYSVWASKAFELTLKNAPLYFYLNSSVPPRSYKLYGDVSSVKEVKHWLYGKYLVFEVAVDVEPGTNRTFIVASYEDREPPSVRIELVTPRRPIAGKQRVSVSIRAEDRSWGVREVKLLYRTPRAGSWSEVAALPASPGRYTASIPPLKTGEVVMKAVAIDWAGNRAESRELSLKYVVVTKTRTSTTTTTTTVMTTTTPITTTTTTATTTAGTTTTTAPTATTTTVTTTTTTPAATTATATITTATTTVATPVTTPTTTATEQLTQRTSLTTTATAVTTAPIATWWVLAVGAVVVAVIVAVVIALRRR